MLARFVAMFGFVAIIAQNVETTAGRLEQGEPAVCNE